MNKQEYHDLQQPLDYKSGKTNKLFDKLYSGKTKNPFWGTERDDNKKRVEHIKIETEYNTYKKEMSPKERLKYEEFLAKK